MTKWDRVYGPGPGGHGDPSRRRPTAAERLAMEAPLTDLERAAVEYVEAADRADAIRNRIGFHAPTPHEADEHIAAIEGAAQASKKLWKAVRDRLATPSDKAADAARKG